jgi:hypothetical protein
LRDRGRALDQVATRRSVKSWHDDTTLIKVPVVVCAVSGTFVGTTYHINDQRLLRRKMQTGTEVHMPPYVLQGNVHVDIWEELLETIDRDQRFMPSTDVRIHPALAGGASAFDFVAVNKDHVAYLSESPK